VLLALRVHAGRSDDQIGSLQRSIQVADGARGFQDIDPPHRPLPGFVRQAAGIHEDELGDPEVLHRPRDRADVALVLRLNEDDAERRHTPVDIL
jgi:hypothetical protein